MFKDFPCGTFVYPRCLVPRSPPAGVKKSFYFFPRFPPAPSPPRGVKGSLNTQFGFFGPDRGFGSRRYGAGLFAQIGKRRSRSQGLNAWRAARQQACAR